ncbi:hypothetical protein EXIGLDRAFT_840610 [Exidia glandulosa HHB12029]|uniref:Uncharacterized protein n=1 Tax=Exidia glandulosa HHB12029 TaxID=1314781 RepID=A0A165ECU2_EXIGL|nr:hypothetical protein EXIGLDRAFT_840610 [Exidia glandulosa HHB12029]
MRFEIALPVALALAPAVLANPAPLQKRDHLITFKNRCGSKTITPAFHAADGTSRYMAALGPGGSTTTTVLEAKAAWRVFGQTGQCSYPDGAGCTLLECSFDNAAFRQCNLSRVDGFNVGIEFSWSDSSCAGNYCLHNTCDGNRAFSTPTNGGASLRQCNTPNVGMTVTFSCDA